MSTNESPASDHQNGARLPNSNESNHSESASLPPHKEPLDESESNDIGPTLSEDCTIYVSNLDPLMAEVNLLKHFQAYGPVKSVHLPKDRSRRSLGYAFVNFSHSEDAAAALQDPSPRLFRNRPFNVAAYQKDRGAIIHDSNSDLAAPAAKPTGGQSAESKSIFIKNLDPLIDSTALYNTFSAFGRILFCKVATNEYGMPKGHAYITFESQQAAEEAISRMNGMLMNDRKVYVGIHMNKWERERNFEMLKINYTNLFVKNIDTATTEDEFRELFAQYGEIDSVSMPVDDSGRPKGFGFVNFKSHDDAVKAVDALKDYMLHDRLLYVNRAQKRYERDEEFRVQSEQARNERMAKYHQGVNLYVKFLDKRVDDEALKEAFAPYGTITSARIMTDDLGVSRGFGFVCYSNPQEAQRAISEMHDRVLHGNKLYVALAQRRDDRVNHGPAVAATAAALAQFTLSPSPRHPHQFPHVPFQPAYFPQNGAAVNGAENGSPKPYYMAAPPSGSASPAMRPYGIVPPSPGGTSSPGGPAMTPAMAGPPHFMAPNSFYYSLTPQGVGAPPPPFFASAPGAGRAPLSFGTPWGGVPPSAAAAAMVHSLQASVAANSAATTPLSGFSNTGPGGAEGTYFSRTTTPHRSRSTTPNGTPTSSTSRGSRQNGQRSKLKASQREQYGPSLLAAIASAANPEAEVQVIGEAIYPHVVCHPAISQDEDLASKITGMLLEQDRAELLKWVDDEPILNRRIQQAYDAYVEYLNSHKQSE